MNRLSNTALANIAFLIFGIFIVGIFCGAFIDRYRTIEGINPSIKFFDPAYTLPDPNEKVFVQYRFGSLIALYLSRGSDDPGEWYEVNELSPNEAKYCLSEMFGLPLRWGRIPSLPDRLVNPRDEKKGAK
jgi:hypothetical protein